MEATAFPAPARLGRTRVSIGAPLLRLRSDEQLVASFRDGNNEAFRVIYDRYRQRLFAYTRQMLPGSRQDAEDALQDVFVRAFGGLRANDRELALRAWLYRIAHNRCIDELRRPAPPGPELMELVRPPLHDPIAEAEQREALRRLIADVRRLPDQQRSALLMRELAGMSYVEIADALSISVAAVKSLLVRARVGLAQATEARDTSCSEIRDDLMLAHDRGVRPNGMTRRHLRDCPGCREFRGHLRGTSREFAALLPALGPLGVLAKLLGFGGGAGGSAAASGGAAAAGGAAGTGGTVASVGVFATGAGHVATILAAAVVTAGGAVEIQHTIAPVTHRAHHRAVALARPARSTASPTIEASQADPIVYAGPAPTQPVQPATTAPPQQVPAARTTPARQPASKADKDTPSTASLGGFADMQPTKSTGATKTGGDDTTGTPTSLATGTTAGQPTDTTGTATGSGGTSTPTSTGGAGSTGPTTGGTGTTGADGSQGSTTGSGGSNGGSGGSGSTSGGSTPLDGTSTS